MLLAQSLEALRSSSRYIVINSDTRGERRCLASDRLTPAPHELNVTDDVAASRRAIQTVDAAATEWRAARDHALEGLLRSYGHRPSLWHGPGTLEEPIAWVHDPAGTFNQNQSQNHLMARERLRA